MINLTTYTEISLYEPTNYLILGNWSDTMSYKLSDAGIPVVKVPNSTSLGYSVYALNVESSTAGASPAGAGASEWRLVESAEFIYMQQAYIERLQAASIIMRDVDGNVVFRAENGEVDCETGTFKNVLITGSSRSPFVAANSSFDSSISDNAVWNTYGSGYNVRNLPWDDGQIGRRITVANYVWNGSLSIGRALISAPEGKYFFEDGVAYKNLLVSREIIELVGFGDSQLRGWIVMNRVDLMSEKTYGKSLKALAVGVCTMYSGSATINARTFDGRILTASKISTGRCRINLPGGWAFSNASDYIVQLTPETVNVRSAANVVAQASSYFEVILFNSDGDNIDSTFNFQITNMQDFDIQYQTPVGGGNMPGIIW